MNTPSISERPSWLKRPKVRRVCGFFGLVKRRFTSAIENIEAPLRKPFFAISTNSNT